MADMYIEPELPTALCALLSRISTAFTFFHVLRILAGHFWIKYAFISCLYACAWPSCPSSTTQPHPSNSAGQNHIVFPLFVSSSYLFLALILPELVQRRLWLPFNPKFSSMVDLSWCSLRCWKSRRLIPPVSPWPYVGTIRKAHNRT